MSKWNRYLRGGGRYLTAIVLSICLAVTPGLTVLGRAMSYNDRPNRKGVIQNLSMRLFAPITEDVIPFYSFKNALISGRIRLEGAEIKTMNFDDPVIRGIYQPFVEAFEMSLQVSSEKKSVNEAFEGYSWHLLQMINTHAKALIGSVSEVQDTRDLGDLFEDMVRTDILYQRWLEKETLDNFKKAFEEAHRKIALVRSEQTGESAEAEARYLMSNARQIALLRMRVIENVETNRPKSSHASSEVRLRRPTNLSQEAQARTAVIVPILGPGQRIKPEVNSVVEIAGNIFMFDRQGMWMLVDQGWMLAASPLLVRDTRWLEMGISADGELKLQPVPRERVFPWIMNLVCVGIALSMITGIFWDRLSAVVPHVLVFPFLAYEINEHRRNRAFAEEEQRFQASKPPAQERDAQAPDSKKSGVWILRAMWLGLASIVAVVSYSYLPQVVMHFDSAVSWKEGLWLGAKIGFYTIFLGSVLNLSRRLLGFARQNAVGASGTLAEWAHEQHMQVSRLPLFDMLANIAYKVVSEEVRYRLITFGGLLWWAKLLVGGLTVLGLPVAPIAAGVISALLFEYAHPKSLINPEKFAAGFITSGIWAYIYYVTGNLWWPIAAHLVHNLIAFGLHKLAGNKTSSRQGDS